MLALSVELHDGNEAVDFYIDHPVDGWDVDPGMLGDGIPQCVDRIDEICRSLGVGAFSPFVWEPLLCELEGLREELEEVKEDGADEEEIEDMEEEIAELEERLKDLWQDPSEALPIVRALIAHLKPQLVLDPSEPGGGSLPDALKLTPYLVWHLRVYEETLKVAEEKGWKFYLEVMS